MSHFISYYQLLLNNYNLPALPLLLFVFLNFPLCKDCCYSCLAKLSSYKYQDVV